MCDMVREAEDWVDITETLKLKVLSRRIRDFLEL